MSPINHVPHPILRKRLAGWCLGSCVLVLLMTAGPSSGARAKVDYLREVKPLLKERCYACHGALKQKGKLRLDTMALLLKGGENGPALVRGNAAGSQILQRVTTTDVEERMPPEHEGEPLKPADVAVLREWIAAGAKAPDNEQAETDPRDHWAFRSRVRPEVPAFSSGKGVRNPIDAFLDKQHQQRGLSPQPEASRAILLRRLYLDLVGLPPSVQEITAFESDPSPDAYERVVDRLLDDERHGERWARHWMDVWRYSDWWGLGAQLRNSQHHIWHWRDWIIESLNHDTPYDEMLRQMLAADELYPNDLEKLRATGFLARNWYIFNRHQWMDETVEHVSKGFLGITMNCTKCHDHKYDPISQVDYYKLRAFFEPYQVRLDMLPGEPDLARDGIPRAFDAFPVAPTYRFVRGDDTKPDQSTAIAPGVPDVLSFAKLEIRPVSLPPEAWQPERRPWVLDAHLAAAKKKVTAVEGALNSAKAKLKEAKDRARNTAESPKPKPQAEPVKVTVKLSQPDPARWKLLGGEWNHTAEGLEQRRDGAEYSAAQWQGEVPRDFDATVRFTIRGGSTFRSVGFSFDVNHPASEASTASNDSHLLVYASAWEKGKKVQASYREGSKRHYPSDGAKPLPIEVGRQYTLRVQARGELINASLDGQRVVAWRSPLTRRDGAMQLTTFDALAVFHEFSLMPLEDGVKLQEPSGSAGLSLEDSIARQTDVQLADLALEVAKAELASVESRAAALRANWTKAKNVQATTRKAIQAERAAALATARHTVMDLEIKLSRATEAKKATAQKQLDTARTVFEKAKAAAAAKLTEADKFTPLEGARWTPTRFGSSTKDDPLVTFSEQSTGRRSALASWMTDARHPLTARVAVNHIWARHMGVPFVPSMFEFGRKSAAPLHPELLDWLASELVESGWSMKHLHRLIVTSAAYRRSSSSAGGELSAAKDPDNLYWWRREPIRLESQAVRDSILTLTGELDTTMGGPPVPPSEQAASKRRSLYFTHSNNERNTFLTTFDEADVRECYRREQSIVPQQALALSNSALVLDAAAKIAQRLGAKSRADDDAAFVRIAFQTILGVPATESEVAACLTTMAGLRQLPDMTSDAVRTQLVWALLNHNDFVTLR